MISLGYIAEKECCLLQKMDSTDRMHQHLNQHQQQPQQQNLATVPQQTLGQRFLQGSSSAALSSQQIPSLASQNQQISPFANNEISFQSSNGILNDLEVTPRSTSVALTGFQGNNNMSASAHNTQNFTSNQHQAISGNSSSTFGFPSNTIHSSSIQHSQKHQSQNFAVVPNENLGSLVNSFVVNPNPNPNPSNSGLVPENDTAADSFPRQAILSSSGFDVVGALVSMATRPNPKIQLGPIDLACAFVISDLRMPDQPIVYASPTFEEMTGFSSSEIVGRNCRFLQHPTQEVTGGSQRLYTDNSVVSKIKRMVINREEGQYTLVNYKKNGEPFLNHVTMIPLRLGKQKSEVTHYIGLQIDLISQPKAIMQKLQNGTYSVNYHQDKSLLQKQETEEPSLDQFPLPVEHITSSSTSSFKLPVHILLSFMEKVPDLIYVLSLRGLFLYVSPESCKNLLEWESTDLLGHKINEFVHPSDLVAVMRDLRNCSSEGNVNFICRMKRKNSGYTYMEMNGHVYNGSKRNRCFIISGREKPLLYLPHNSFYNPEAESHNETWLRTSPQGLILYCSNSASSFFQQDSSSITGSSLFEWIETNQHTPLSKALSSNSCESVKFTMNIQAHVFIYLFRFLHAKDSTGGTRWIQIKKDSSSSGLNPILLLSDTNLYHVIQSVRSSSIYYECNKIRVRNSKLLEEIQSQLASSRESSLS